MPVVTNTFSGEDTNYNKSEYIDLPLMSASSTQRISIYSSLSKTFAHAIYTTLLDAGYNATYNENVCSINIWGFEFYPIINSYIQVFIKGLSNSTPLISNNSTTYRINVNSSYSFSVTVRGSSDAFNILIGGMGYETSENPILFLAKAVHIPTNKNGFFCMSDLCSSSNIYSHTYFEDNLYTIYNKCTNYLKYFSVNNQANYLGTGKGYILVPQLTSDSAWYIKGLVESNTALLSPNKYYKLNNEIYYSNNNRLLYRVDI